MLIAMIRPAEKHVAKATGTEIPDLQAELIAGAPEGWEMVSAHVEMQPGGIRIVEGKFERRDELTEIEAEDLDALMAKVPEGWQVLSVRRP